MILDRPLLIEDVSKLKKCFAVEGVNPGMIVEMITTINKPIKTLHLEIKKAISEDTGGHFYGLVCILFSLRILKKLKYFVLSESFFFQNAQHNKYKQERACEHLQSMIRFLAKQTTQDHFY